MATSEAELREALASLQPLVDAERRPQLDEFTERLAGNRLRLLLVGEAKRGKSTLANALLGRGVLPMGVVPVTAVPTTVAQGSPERVEVLLRDGSVRVTDVGALSELVTEVGNPGNRRGVAQVRIFLDATGLPPGVELVDTPGVGSVHLRNTAEAHLALATMDVAVLVVTADPPISASEVALLREVRERSVRLFVVVNKTDHLDGDEREEVLRFTHQVLAPLCRTPPPLFLCSARDGLRARREGDPIGWRVSGVAALLEALQSQVTEHGQGDLRASVARSAHRLAGELLDETALRIRAAQLQDAHLQEQLEAFRSRLRESSRRAEEAVAVAGADARQLQRSLDAARDAWWRRRRPW